MIRQRTTMSAVISGCALAVILFAVPAAAQSTVSQSDIQRLQDEVYQAGSDISRMRAGNSSNLQTELDDLRDEVIYLKVKLRKEGSVDRTEYADVRDRLQNLRSRARGESTGTWQGSGTRPGTSTGVGGGVSGGTSSSGTSSSGTSSSGTIYDERDRRQGSTQQTGSSSIPTGQEIDVRLQTPLSSNTAQVEQRFEATTVADLFRGSDVLIPAGSLVRGVVSSVNPATRTDRRGSLTLSFDQVTVNGRNYPMRGTVTQALESEGIKGEAGRIGAGSAVGAIIGGIMGGVKGALLGVLIGGGGTIAATEGTDVKLPAGTLLRVRLDQPPAIR
jgi:hypothetical protein